MQTWRHIACGVAVASVCAAALGSVAVSSSASAASNSAQTDRVCLSGTLGATSTTTGGTTVYNRQASVQDVCEGFGSSAHFDLGTGVACAVLAAGIGANFDKTATFISGLCDGDALASGGVSSENACGALSDLLGTVPIPLVKAFATGSAIACSLAHPFGEWLESESEENAAKAVIQQGKCLRFETHSFPLTDQWDAIPCAPNDPGFTITPGTVVGIIHLPTVATSTGSGSGGATTTGSQSSPLPAGQFYVMNANGGIYWRSSPDWGAAEAISGNGFYPDTVVAVGCYAQGAANVPGSSNAMWEQASWKSGPGAGTGWINEHFVDDGSALNQPSPGIPPCSASAGGGGGGGGGGAGPGASVAASNNNGQMAVQVTNFPTGLTYFFCHAGDPSQYPTGGTITYNSSVTITSANQSWSSGLCSGGHSTNMWIGFQGTDGHDYYSNQVVIDVAASPGASASVFGSNGQMSLELSNFPTGTNYYFCHQGDPSLYPTGGAIIGHGQLNVTSPNGTYGPLCSGSGNAWIGVQGSDGHDYYSNEISL